MKPNNEITDFILAHYPPYRGWDREILLQWVDWHNGHGFIQCVLNDDETLAGIAVCRPVMKPEQGGEPYLFDQEGDCIFVDLAIATKKWAIQGLVFAAIKRFGMRNWIAWAPDPYNVIECHDADRFCRLILHGAMK